MAQDRAEIERLLYQYALAIDNRDAAALSDCFADGVMTRAVAEKTIKFHRLFEYTIHRVANPLYTVQDGRIAGGMHYSTVSYVKKSADGLTKFDTYARYENDQLVKQGNRWLFAKLRQWTPLFSTEEVPVQKDLPPGFRDALAKIFAKD